MDSGIDYEFRTTALPRMISRDNFIDIGHWLNGAKKYCLQQFKPVEGMIDSSFVDERTYSEDELNEFRKILEPYFDEVEVRV